MSTWQEIETSLAKVNTTDYARSNPKEPDTYAREVIRRAFLELERKAAERDTLRALLLELGTENARLSVELERARVRLDQEVTTGE